MVHLCGSRVVWQCEAYTSYNLFSISFLDSCVLQDSCIHYKWVCHWGTSGYDVVRWAVIVIDNKIVPSLKCTHPLVADTRLHHQSTSYQQAMNKKNKTHNHNFLVAIIFTCREYVYMYVCYLVYLPLAFLPLLISAGHWYLSELPVGRTLV